MTFLNLLKYSPPIQTPLLTFALLVSMNDVVFPPLLSYLFFCVWKIDPNFYETLQKFKNTHRNPFLRQVGIVKIY
jgi:hypothetical protein